MQVKIILGIFLVIVGLFHIIRPYKVLRVLDESYRYNPFLKNKKQRVIHPKFIIIFGIAWILVGLSVIFLP
jgi:uncharacterized membrane protein HdeD (DUF308 family)